MHKVRLGVRTQTVAEWIEEYGADRGTVLIRITAGWSLHKALTEPLRPPLKYFGPGSKSRVKTTPWFGVFKRSDKPGYRVKLRHGVKGDSASNHVNLGTFACDKEAAAIYNIWSRNTNGVNARINLC